MRTEKLIEKPGQDVVKALLVARYERQMRQEFGPWDLNVGVAWKARLLEDYRVGGRDDGQKLHERILQVECVRRIYVLEELPSEAFELRLLDDVEVAAEFARDVARRLMCPRCETFATEHATWCAKGWAK